MKPPPRIDLRLVSIALGTAAMLLAEILLGGQANYVYSDEFNLLMPILVFGGMALGSVVGLIRPVQALDVSTVLLAVAVAIAVAFAGISHAPALGFVWVALPIVGFGVYLCKTLSDAPLRTVVWALGIGGALLYLALDLLVVRLGAAMLLLLIATTVAAACAARWTPRRVAVGAVVVAASAGAFWGHVFDALSFVEREAPGLAGARHLGPPIFTPLIRTDLLQTTDDARVLTTNGSRFAVLPRAESVETAMREGRRSLITYDAPYFAVQPRSVLVIGSAEGENVLSALAHHAESVVAVDINPAVFQILKGEMAAFTGGLYNEPRVESVASEGRRYVEVSGRTFDLITVQGVQTGSANDLLHTALLESYLYTDEATQAMWNALSPSGALYIDEYVRRQDRSVKDVTLVGAIAGAAVDRLHLDPSTQCMAFKYDQALDNPNRSGRRREAVILTKTPMPDDVRAEALRQILEKGGRFEPGACRKPPPEDARLLDDRPFFVREVLLRFAAWLPLLVGAAAAGIGLWLAVRRRFRVGMPNVPVVPMLLTGVGYIAFVLGITGPATLLLGDPQLTTPVVFVGMYAWGLIGGLVTLRIGRARVIVGVALLAAYLIVLTFALPHIKPWLLPIPSSAVRAALVGVLLMPAALLAEVPYVYLLNLVEGRARGQAFAWENVGTLLGLPVGFYCQIRYGSGAALLASAAAYGLALLATLAVPAAGMRAPAATSLGSSP
jgi:hypothetical protein